jgi:plastocyanin
VRTIKRRIIGQAPAKPGLVRAEGDPMVTRRERQAPYRRVVAALVAALILASCGDGGEEESATSPSPEETTATTPAPAEPTVTTSPSPEAEATEVTVTLTEFSIELSEQTFAPGAYEFVAEEEGELPHALSIEGPGVDSTSTEVIQPGGESQTLTVTLQPGTYEIWCPVGNHRAQGMETTITVE